MTPPPWFCALSSLYLCPQHTPRSIYLPSCFTGHCPKKRIYMRMVKSAVIMDWSDHVSKYLVSYILKWHCWHCAEPAVSLPPFVLSKCSLVWFHLFGSIKPVVVQHLKSLHSTIYPMCPNKDHGTSWVCPLTYLSGLKLNCPGISSTLFLSAVATVTDFRPVWLCALLRRSEPSGSVILSAPRRACTGLNGLWWCLLCSNESKILS